MRIPNPSFWKNKKVLITGHSGFKGSWLTLWLNHLGANCSGVSLPPPTEPNLFNALKLKELCNSQFLDIRNFAGLKEIFTQEKPDILFHLAAQPLVRYSYENPLETYEVNVQGTAHVLEACRQLPSLKSLVIITTDKCYENKEWVWGYRETDPMGGHDPYSSSKGCAELLVSSYRRSFFKKNGTNDMSLGLASARAGNVLGGGDWALDRIIPDAVRSFSSKKVLEVRNPGATRPWQHVLEPLNGYICLAEDAYKDPNRYSDSFNFGPSDDGCLPVANILKLAQKFWGSPTEIDFSKSSNLHEAQFLKLDISKAKQLLNWEPIWNIEKTIQHTVDWYKVFISNPESHDTTRAYTIGQIDQFCSLQK
jgi:CDP-glucose 4,6-dehydratase